MVGLAIVVFTVCCSLCCMVLEYLVSNGADCSWVVILEGVADMSMLVLAVKVIFWVAGSVWGLMSIGDVVLGNTQLMVLECAVDSPVMKLLVKYGPVITVFVVNNCGMKAFAWNGPVMNVFVNNSPDALIWVMNGPVMNVFQRETAVVVLLAENGPVMNDFLKETVEMMLPANNGHEMIDL